MFGKIPRAAVRRRASKEEAAYPPECQPMATRTWPAMGGKLSTSHASGQVVPLPNTSATASAANTTSSRVVNRPIENRRHLHASSGVMPRARSTCDGPITPDVQADPVAAATRGCNFSSKSAATIPGSLTCRQPGWRAADTQATETWHGISKQVAQKVSARRTRSGARALRPPKPTCTLRQVRCTGQQEGCRASAHPPDLHRKQSALGAHGASIGNNERAYAPWSTNLVTGQAQESRLSTAACPRRWQQAPALHRHGKTRLQNARACQALPCFGSFRSHCSLP